MNEPYNIGDIVTVKENEYRPRNEDNSNRLYVVRYIPQRLCGIYVYCIILNYNNGLHSFRFKENQVKKYNGVVDASSPIVFLQKIIKNEIAVTEQTWADLKNGKVLLDETGTFRNLKEYKDGDTWNWFSNTISRQDTGLAGDLLISYGCFYKVIDDYLPKIRIHATDDYEQDFYVTIEELPRIIIGRNTSLTEEELQKIYTYIAEHLDILLEYWASDGKMDGRDLYTNLGLNEKEQK